MDKNTNPVPQSDLQSLPNNIQKNSKGELILPASNKMRLDILLKGFANGFDDAALLKKHPNLKPVDLAAARQYVNIQAHTVKTEINKSTSVPPKPAPNQKLATQLTKPKPTLKPALVLKPRARPLVKSVQATIRNRNLAATTSTNPLYSSSSTEKLHIKELTTRLGVEIVRFYKSLPPTEEAQVIGNQLLRSGTSVGAHYREAMYARTRSEFSSKIAVGLQELEETKYWLQLLVDGGIVSASNLANLRQAADTLTTILENWLTSA